MSDYTDKALLQRSTRRDDPKVLPTKINRHTYSRGRAVCRRNSVHGLAATSTKHGELWAHPWSLECAMSGNKLAM